MNSDRRMASAYALDRRKINPRAGYFVPTERRTTTTARRSVRHRSPSPSGRRPGLEVPDLVGDAPVSPRPPGPDAARARLRRRPHVRSAEHVRYATDTTNMQIWAMHDPFRACLVTADGHMVMWEFGRHRRPAGTAHNPLVREIRAGAGFFYFAAGDAYRIRAGGPVCRRGRHPHARALRRRTVVSRSTRSWSTVCVALQRLRDSRSGRERRSPRRRA